LASISLQNFSIDFSELETNVKKYKKPKILFLKNYVAGTWLEFIKTLEGANDDLVVANTGVLVPNANGSLESSNITNNLLSVAFSHVRCIINFNTVTQD
jgi:hypothetical protein